MRSNDHTSRQTPCVQVFERMYAILDFLAGHTQAVSLKQISSATGLHPSTAHRILNDLVIGRLVERPESGNYRLGLRLLELGNLVKARLSVREIALPLMRELHHTTQQAINLSVHQGDEIVYIERSFSERSGMQVVRAIGGHAPLHLTSTGKLFLAEQEQHWIRAYAMRTGLVGNTRNSITRLETLERELQHVRQSGVAHDREELELGVNCIAAGVYDDQARLVAGVSISAPAGRLEEAWVGKLKEAVREISSALGVTRL